MRFYSGVAGILFVVLVAAASAVSGQPANPTSAASDLAGTLNSHRTGILFGVDLQFLSILPFFLFLAGLYRALVSGDAARAPWGVVMVAAGIAAGSLVLVAQSILGVLVAFLLPGIPADVGKGLYAAYSGVYQASDVPLAVFLIAASIGVLLCDVFPRWTTWVGLLGALGMVIGAFAYAEPESLLTVIDLIGLALTAIFILSLSVTMLRGIGQDAAENAPGPITS